MKRKAPDAQQVSADAEFSEAMALIQRLWDSNIEDRGIWEIWESLRAAPSKRRRGQPLISEREALVRGYAAAATERLRRAGTSANAARNVSMLLEEFLGRAIDPKKIGGWLSNCRSKKLPAHHEERLLVMRKHYNDALAHAVAPGIESAVSIIEKLRKLVGGQPWGKPAKK